MTQTETPPIVYPTVTVGGVTYSLKFGLGSMYRLERAGVNPGNLKAEIQNALAKGRNLDMIFTLLAAALGQVRDGRWVRVEYSAAELADMMESAEFTGLAETIIAALGKVSPPAGAPPAAGTTGQ